MARGVFPSQSFEGSGAEMFAEEQQLAGKLFMNPCSLTTFPFSLLLLPFSLTQTNIPPPFYKGSTLGYFFFFF